MRPLRAPPAKYHSGGLWSNTCCGHPRPGEPILDAAHRRLRAEMGIAGCELVIASRFIYRAELPRGLVEHEVDYVVAGQRAGEPKPRASEVSEWRWEDGE